VKPSLIIVCTIVAAAVLAGCQGVKPYAGTPSSFDIPLLCPSEEDCWTVHHYPDLDPGPGVLDFKCGTKGTDGDSEVKFRIARKFRYKSVVQAVSPAAGKVMRMRNGMEDDLYANGGLGAVKGKECGNGIRISHGGGLESQICHLQNDSMTLHPGDLVEAGQIIGLVGQSGFASEPYLGVVFYHHGEKIDPFAGPGITNTCGDTNATLWGPRARAKLAF